MDMRGTCLIPLVVVLKSLKHSVRLSLLFFPIPVSAVLSAFVHVSFQLLGVTATCALELGVDIGELDVTLHLGFPGAWISFQLGAVWMYQHTYAAGCRCNVSGE